MPWGPWATDSTEHENGRAAPVEQHPGAEGPGEHRADLALLGVRVTGTWRADIPRDRHDGDSGPGFQHFGVQVVGVLSRDADEAEADGAPVGAQVLWVPKTFATWADPRGNASARGLRQVAGGPVCTRLCVR